MDKSDIAKRMKCYEASTTKYKFLPLVPICARIDGRSFSSFTKGLDTPYDERLNKVMVNTTKRLVEETGALIGYTQSDEISLVWLQKNYDSQIFFNGRYFKMISNLASLSTVYFYKNLLEYIPEKSNKFPSFDCRIWQVPNKCEASNYLVWREMDATRNSISMLAQYYFSHKQLYKKNVKMMMDMLITRGINWNDEPAFFKRGTYVQRTKKIIPFSSGEIERLPLNHEARKNPNLKIERTIVEAIKMPKITSITNRESVFFEGETPILEKIK